jgi:hypothetical protein
MLCLRPVIQLTGYKGKAGGGGMSLLAKVKDSTEKYTAITREIKASTFPHKIHIMSTAITTITV